MLTIQVTPNWSTHMPNSSPHICLSSGHGHGAAVGELLPVAAQLVGVVAAEADGHGVPACGCIPGGVSEAISVKPLSVSSVPCMILSASASGLGELAEGVQVSSPPKTHW